MLKAGAGQAEITPSVGTPLSGFIARENRPSTGIDTPLFVRALALLDRGRNYLLLSYDLIGIGSVLEEKILSAIEQELGQYFSRDRCVLIAVHNHSGPAVGLLVGEQAPNPLYLDKLATQSISAVREALAVLQPAKLYKTERRLPGLTYNRRALLSDGRVSISPIPDLPVVRRGPLDDHLTILLFRNPEGRNLAALAHYACHGVAVLSQNIGGDIPGALAAEISAELEAPCLVLQGAAGDVNPTCVTASRNELQHWIESALFYLRDLQKNMRPISEGPFKTVSSSLALKYDLFPPLSVVENQARNLEQIARGEISLPGVQETLRKFKNILNLPPEAPIDPAQTQFIARALSEHMDRVLEATRSEGPPPTLPMNICVWRLGEVVLVFLAGEIFTSTGLKIRALSNKLTILPISYLASLVGYLPDQEALSLGGYEVDDAWRFYGQPAPFAVGSEARLIEVLAGLIREVSC
jgi:neutral ceramidase